MFGKVLRVPGEFKAGLNKQLQKSRKSEIMDYQELQRVQRLLKVKSRYGSGVEGKIHCARTMPLKPNTRELAVPS